MNELKFYYQEYRHINFWSQKLSDYYLSFDIGDQVWDHKTVPTSGVQLSLKDIIGRLPDLRNDKEAKKHRSLIMRFNDVYQFPLKQNIGYDKWNGIIFIDLDMQHSKRIDELDKEKTKLLYEGLYDALLYEANNNFYYIEHSSSGKGMHIMFFYDIERTEENYHMCAAYTRNLLETKIDKYIKDFSSCIKEKGVFDSVYDRPYQKCFITGIDAKFNDDCNGQYIDNELVKFKKEKVYYVNDNDYEIVNIFDVSEQKEKNHNDRFFIYTALKKVTSSKEECERIWKTKICPQFKLYRDYTLKIFQNEFNYDQIDTRTAKVWLLEEFGFDVKQNNNDIINYNLKDDEFLGDILQDVLKNVEVGINFLQAPTGSGKTRCWTDFNKSILNDVLDKTHKSILVIEPLNSIITTKYDDNEVIKVFGSKKFPKDFLDYNMYVTNYNKLLRMKEGKYYLREDIDKFFSNFSLIVIDESHSIIKDSFRFEVLRPFVDSIKKASENTKIILQTATPMHEDKIFDIKKKIIVYKKNNKHIKYISRIYNKRKKNGELDKFDINEINCLVNYYVSNGRKVYVYWSNGALVNLKAFKNTYCRPERVAIYHKRNINQSDDESMTYINENHRLGDEYDVLLSSVYFGVGNDLDDECDAAVIIIGNLTWQEDIQAIGRWRNSKYVEVCQIILPNEIDECIETSKQENDGEEILTQSCERMKYILCDKIHKDKSVIINKKAYMLNDEEDCKMFGLMNYSSIYDRYIRNKWDKFESVYYDFDVREDLNKNLECNDDYNEKNKNYWKGVKEIRNKEKYYILTHANTVNVKDYNHDPNQQKFVILCKDLVKYEVEKVVDAKYICKSGHYNIMNMWINFYKRVINRNIDFPELFSLLWINNKFKDEDDTKIIKIWNTEITMKEYYSIIGYVMYVMLKNDDMKDFRLLSNYYSTYKWYAYMFKNMEKRLINMFYETRAQSEIQTYTKEFFGDNYVDIEDEKEKIILHSLKDFKAKTKENSYMKNEVEKIVNFCLNYKKRMQSDGGKVGGKVGGKKTGKNTKTIKILVDFPKYGLKKGQKFESCTKLAKICNLRMETISRWLKTNKLQEI